MERRAVSAVLLGIALLLTVTALVRSPDDAHHYRGDYTAWGMTRESGIVQPPLTERERSLDHLVIVNAHAVYLGGSWDLGDMDHSDAATVMASLVRPTRTMFYSFYGLPTS